MSKVGLGFLRRVLFESCTILSESETEEIGFKGPNSQRGGKYLIMPYIFYDFVS